MNGPSHSDNLISMAPRVAELRPPHPRQSEFTVTVSITAPSSVSTGGSCP